MGSVNSRSRSTRQPDNPNRSRSESPVSRPNVVRGERVQREDGYTALARDLDRRCHVIAAVAVMALLMINPPIAITGIALLVCNHLRNQDNR